MPVTGAVTPVDSFSPCFLRAVSNLVLRSFPEPSVAFIVLTAAASLTRILVLITTPELRRRAALIDTISTFSGTVLAALDAAFLNDCCMSAAMN